MTATTEYVVITETVYNGPSRTHAIVRDDDDDKQSPVYATLEEALAATPDQSGPMYLGHNEASVDTSAWEVVREINPADWGTWPSNLEDAATEILTDLGIDPEDPDAVENVDFDLPVEAAQRLGWCLVPVDGEDYCLLCKPLSDD